MMYSQKLVASLKANGKILREFQDTIFIPFGSEYSVLLKNLNTIRCIVNVFIDGDNVVPGGLVLGPGQECNLERSISNGNLQEGNRFKFIEFTDKIENHRGVKLEDGIIRVEYQFEKVYQRQDGIQWNNIGNNTGPFNPVLLRSGVGSTAISYATDSAVTTLSSVNVNAITAQAAVNDVGITVAGSKSDQKFSTAMWFPTETKKHTIVLKIRGETAENKRVAAPVTVKTKPKCTTCGTVNKATSKFCSNCGTALQIF